MNIDSIPDYTVAQTYSGRFFAWTCGFCGRHGHGHVFNSREGAVQAAQRHLTKCKARLADIERLIAAYKEAK